MLQSYCRSIINKVKLVKEKKNIKIYAIRIEEINFERKKNCQIANSLLTSNEHGNVSNDPLLETKILFAKEYSFKFLDNDLFFKYIYKFVK